MLHWYPNVPIQPPEGWVLFDGDCGICNRLAVFWKPTLQRLGFAVAPLQSPWVEEQTGLPRDELVRELRLLPPDGRLISGADVYRHVMRRIWWAYPLYLLSELPGLSSLFDWIYRTFARQRTRISATCAVSDSNPGGSRG